MMIEPPPLRGGDCIAIIAPASLPKETSEITDAKALLEKRGFKVKLASNVYASWGNFAGTDQERAQGVMEAFQDETVKAIWALKGGYGSGRILDALDYEWIKHHPKMFIGMSDITALHVALNQKAHLITYLGPTANFLFHPEKNKMRAFAEESAWKVLLKQERFHVFKGETVLAPGEGEGMLTGGNLSLIAAHLGTPWQIETKGKILILEDVNEYSYRVDRMLNQLKQGGIFDEIAGLVLCSWNGCLPQHPIDFTLDEVLKNFFTGAPFPVLGGFPMGHIEEQAMLPLGKTARLSSIDQTLIIE